MNKVMGQFKGIVDINGEIKLYGRSYRPADKPLAFVYEDEIIIPMGVSVSFVPDAGAMRIRFSDKEEAEGIEAMTEAAKDQADNKAWAKLEADRMITYYKAQGIGSTAIVCAECLFKMDLEQFLLGICPHCEAPLK